jgi:plastocyanin
MGWSKASAALLAISMAGCGTPVWQQQSSTNKARKHVVVQFTNATLHPSVARVLPGGDVAWVNYASGLDGTVVFPASIRQAFTCSSLRPIFMETAAGYQSIPVTGSMENVVLPCPLKPGEYEYKLQLFEGGTLMGAGDGAAGMDNPTSEMAGKIIVGE